MIHLNRVIGNGWRVVFLENGEQTLKRFDTIELAADLLEKLKVPDEEIDKAVIRCYTIEETCKAINCQFVHLKFSHVELIR